jgi:hypothetical protein
LGKPLTQSLTRKIITTEEEYTYILCTVTGFQRMKNFRFIYVKVIISGKKLIPALAGISNKNIS